MRKGQTALRNRNLTNRTVRGPGPAFLLPTAKRRGDRLADSPMSQADAYRMIRRRADDAGIQTKSGNHTFRATGITAYLKNGGRLENRPADRRARVLAHHRPLLTGAAMRLASMRSSAWGFERVELA
jgi:integrase